MEYEEIEKRLIANDLKFKVRLYTPGNHKYYYDIQGPKEALFFAAIKYSMERIALGVKGYRIDIFDGYEKPTLVLEA